MNLVFHVLAFNTNHSMMPNNVIASKNSSPRKIMKINSRQGYSIITGVLPAPGRGGFSRRIKGKMARLMTSSSLKSLL